MSIKIKYDDMPTQNTARTSFEKEGIYILENVDVIEDTSNDGAARFVMSHHIIGTDINVNYDYYKVQDKQGVPIAYGASKLRTLIDAVGIEVPEITGPLLKALLKGRQFKANVVKNDNGYPNINFQDIYPLSYEIVALNELPFDTEEDPVSEFTEEKGKVVTKTNEVEEDDI